MDQKPIFDKTFITGIVNDVNYSPVNQGEAEETFEEELAQKFKGHECKEECRCCIDKTEEISFGPCDEFKDFVVHNVHLYCEGRILKVKVQLRISAPAEE